MGRLATALSRHSGESVAVDGQSDLVIAGRKIGGSAQRRGRRAVLFHGSLLLNAEPDLMGKYLHEPGRRPAYRGERRHHEFVRNAGWPVSLAEKAVKECLFVGEHLDFNIGNSHISRLFCD
jgi:lipoate-protein ligase A